MTLKCAPRRVGAMEPVGMTKASTMNARNVRATIRAMMIASMVSITPASELSDGFCCEGVVGRATCGAGVGMIAVGMAVLTEDDAVVSTGEVAGGTAPGAAG